MLSLGNKTFQKKASFKQDVEDTQHTHPIHTYLYAHMHKYTYMYICMHTCTYATRAHTSMHAYTHIIHAHMHACMHAYTHTHTSLLSPPSQQLPFSVKLQLFYQPKFLQRIVTRTKSILFLGLCVASLCLKHKSSVPCYSCRAV